MLGEWCLYRTGARNNDPENLRFFTVFKDLPLTNRFDFCRLAGCGAGVTVSPQKHWRVARLGRNSSMTEFPYRRYGVSLGQVGARPT